MKIGELIALASEAYDADGVMMSYWNSKTNKPKRGRYGDSLAEFVVQELYETFDPKASDSKQLEEAIRVMDIAASQLVDVVVRFRQRRNEVT